MAHGTVPLQVRAVHTERFRVCVGLLASCGVLRQVSGSSLRVNNARVLLCTNKNEEPPAGLEVCDMHCVRDHDY